MNVPFIELPEDPEDESEEELEESDEFSEESGDPEESEEGVGKGNKMAVIAEAIDSGEISLLEAETDGSILDQSGFAAKMKSTARKNLLKDILKEGSESGSAGGVLYVMQKYKGTYYIACMKNDEIRGNSDDNKNVEADLIPDVVTDAMKRSVTDPIPDSVTDRSTYRTTFTVTLPVDKSNTRKNVAESHNL